MNGDASISYMLSFDQQKKKKEETAGPVFSSFFFFFFQPLNLSLSRTNIIPTLNLFFMVLQTCDWYKQWFSFSNFFFSLPDDGNLAP